VFAGSDQDGEDLDVALHNLAAVATTPHQARHLVALRIRCRLQNEHSRSP
jgi:hypothetical protein